MLYALIMAGGRGTRFWPRSRTKTPKQLQRIAGRRTMLQETVARIRPIIPEERILVAPGKPLVKEVRRQVPKLPARNLIVEPIGRDTAPCIALAASLLYRRDKDAVMVVLPADHVIQKGGEFRKIVKAASRLAVDQDALITLGIKVIRPETGYGYIEMGKELGTVAGRPYYRVNRFAEKPPLATAKRYMKKGNYYWNSGMFVWRASVIRERVKELLPGTFKKCEKIASAKNRSDFAKRMKTVFPAIDPISIDYGVMEKAENILGLASDIGWSDVGNWNSLEEVLPADESGNVVVGSLLGKEAKDLVVHAPGKLVAAIGVTDLVIVDTPDALLVCPKDRVQQIKDVVADLEKAGKKEYL